MKLKSLAAGAVLAAASLSAYAGDQTVNVIADGASHNWDAFIGDGLLSGGLDVITFSVATPGTYEVAISVTGQKLTFDTSSNLNGITADVWSVGKLRFVASELTGLAPFVLNLGGSALAGASYTGTYSVTAVPEPTTYAMLLGGLGLVGAIARRKAKNAA
ncbi:PEP-CTERM protein-sorting domain-containing protein [Duganella sp. CF402]|uniref:FxDxF family PEP-CTERM protein n=1 Tax=unclassified Duganella TaxID=2636909 RepID=UPI0008B52260|nr:MULTISPECIES: FxDxF family PEP-CTERM protein [unclassified Duganella]RZT01885.1 putative secreted protein with PEP-CTERM sorting signal [Duganella sp. BK701]SEN19895.1 PEP-CTERM protein-sorting domain-containing protein [Duganella sp. CF402]